MVDTERVAAYFDRLASSMPEPSGAFATPADTKRRKMRTLTSAAGQKRMSTSLRRQLAECADRVRVHTDLPLDDPTLGPDDTVRFSKAPFAASDLCPSSEDSLRAWTISIVGRPGTPLARCYRPETEFRIPGTGRRIDLLLHERGAAGNFAGFVVVEFEHTAPAGTVAQTLGYMHQLRSTRLAEGKYVRGVIISANEHRAEQRLLHEIDDDLEWFVLDATLRRVMATVQVSGEEDAATALT